MSMQPVKVTLNIDTSALIRALDQATRAAHMLGANLHRSSLAWLAPESRRKHRRRCPMCSPIANPRPLAFDGHAYRRRTRKRGNR